MNYARIVLAALAATVVYFLCGGLVFGQFIAKYDAPYPGVYRSADAIQGYFPIGTAPLIERLRP